MSSAAQNYLEEHREQHLEELKQFLRIPSISTLTEHTADVAEAGKWLSEAFLRAGLQNVQVYSTAGHPIVYGDYLQAEGQPTVLIYGHYDVQPVDPLELWTTPPFEPTIRDGKLYGRGTSDDKAQVFMHLKAVEALLKTDGKLPVNIKFCIEGEEEIASPHLPSFVEANSELLAADVVVISDSPILEKGRPSLTYGLRGACTMVIDVEGPKSDLHSGLFGGGVPNPIGALVELLASMKDAEGRVTIQGFYDRVLPLSETERAALAEVPFDESKLQKDLGLSSLFGEKGYSYIERTTARPTLEINGISGGYEGDGFKMIVPSKAHAKVSCRLVGDQNPDEIMDQIEEHIKQHAPVGVQVKLTRLSKGNPFVVPLDNPYVQKAAIAYEKSYGIPPVYMRGGGSIPIVEVFHRLLHTPVVLMGFGLPDENFHAPNEHFTLENYDKGLKTLLHYWSELGERE